MNLGKFQLRPLFLNVYENDPGRRVMSKLLKPRDSKYCRSEYAAFLIAIFARNANHEMKEKQRVETQIEKEQGMLLDDIMIRHLS